MGLGPNFDRLAEYGYMRDIASDIPVTTGAEMDTPTDRTHVRAGLADAVKDAELFLSTDTLPIPLPLQPEIRTENLDSFTEGLVDTKPIPLPTINQEQNPGEL